MSNIEFLNKDKETEKVTFLLKDSTPEIANALRRLIMENVPTIAIEEVEFYENTSAFYDEVLAHRLGLVPLTTDLKGYTLPQECKCNSKGCNSCTVKLSLKVKGPGYVYAKDLKSKDPAIKPVHSEMILAKLLKDQEIQIEATAMLGEGKNHVKWSPGLCWYTYKATVTVNNNSPKMAQYKEKYPSQVFKDGKIDKQLIIDLNLVDACDGICEDIVKVDHDPETFIFNIEPWGQLSAKEMFTEALKLFDKKLKELEEKLSK